MDLLVYLRKHNVKYYTSGNNVSPGWIGMKCLFCHDKSNHLGIRIKDLKCNCWKCGSHSMISVIKILNKCSFKKAKEILKTITYIKTRYDLHEEEEQKRVLRLPDTISPLPPQYRSYLQHERKFPDVKYLETYYNLSACTDLSSKYKFRIIIPMYHQHEMKCFTARSIFEGIKPKYDGPQKHLVIATPKQVVYNHDAFKEGTDMVILEGVTDVWRWGTGAVGLNGIAYSMDQLKILRMKKIRNLFTIFDQGKIAQRRAKELLKLLAPYAKNVERVVPRIAKDIGDMTETQIREIKSLIKFNEV